MIPRSSRRSLIAAFAVPWMAAVAWGFYALARYDATPGASAEAPAHWPSDAPLALDPTRLTLLLFAHPRCPCTRATLGELDRVIAASGERLSAHVLFYSDPKLGAD